jgi:hypothetical protein
MPASRAASSPVKWSSGGRTIQTARLILANATRQKLPQLQSMITGLDALQSVNFKGVGPAGADIYQLKFEKGSLEYRISLGPDGVTRGAQVRPAQ